MDRVSMLTEMYKSMTEAQRQEEIDAVFDIIYAMLEATECDSMESYPNTNVRLKFSCELIKDECKFYC